MVSLDTASDLESRVSTHNGTLKLGKAASGMAPSMAPQLSIYGTMTPGVMITPRSAKGGRPWATAIRLQRAEMRWKARRNPQGKESSGQGAAWPLGPPGLASLYGTGTGVRAGGRECHRAACGHALAAGGHDVRHNHQLEHCAFVLWMSKAVSRPTHAPRFRLLLPGILVEYVCRLFNGLILDDSFQDVDDGLESLEWHEAQRFDQLP